MKKIAMVAVYSFVDELLEVIHQVKEKKPDKMVVYSPTPLHDVEEALEKKRSPVRFFTLIGGLAGLSGGFALAIWSSMKWNLITGGKPVNTFPPFLIIGFEMTILIGAIATLIGLIITDQFPNYRISNTYDRRFSRDKFGLAIKISEDEKKTYEDIFRSTGAEEINVR